MTHTAPYTDGDLSNAVRSSRSWRGVLRSLGLTATSAGSMRAVRRRADALGLDYSHFTGQRRWSDGDLADAVEASRTWTEVVDRLGLASTGGSSQALVKSHAARLSLDVAHLTVTLPAFGESPFSGPADLHQLDRAGPVLAASWFMLRGYSVAWPLEPCRYDLLAASGEQSYRIQVKTTTSRSGGSWAVRISSTRPRATVVYTPDEVDYFFLVDGDPTFYLIPLRVVGGYQVIYLNRYTSFIVGQQRLADAS
jgi:hypothetical protein